MHALEVTYCSNVIACSIRCFQNKTEKEKEVLGSLEKHAKLRVMRDSEGSGWILPEAHSSLP